MYSLRNFFYSAGRRNREATLPLSMCRAHPSKLISGNYGGNWLRAFCLMMFTSPVVIAPLALISLRKLELVTVRSACALHKLVSPLVTIPLALTSPTSTPIDAERELPRFPGESLTLLKLTVMI